MVKQFVNPYLNKGTVTIGNFSYNLSYNFIAPLWDKFHTTLPSVTPLRNAGKIHCSVARIMVNTWDWYNLRLAQIRIDSHTNVCLLLQKAYMKIHANPYWTNLNLFRPEFEPILYNHWEPLILVSCNYFCTRLRSYFLSKFILNKFPSSMCEVFDKKL